MYDPLTNTKVLSIIELLESVTGYTLEAAFLKENLLKYNIELKQVGDTGQNEKIIELRLKTETVTCYYEAGKPCTITYLFPDDEKDIEDYIHFFKMNYVARDNNCWVNPVTRHIFQVSNDQDAGYIISCRKE